MAVPPEGCAFLYLLGRGKLRPNWPPEQLVETERIKETDVTQLEAQDSTEEG